LGDPEYRYRRVVIAGVVQSVGSERPGFVDLEIRAEKTTVWARVPASGTAVDAEWIDGDVRASGVLAEFPAESGEGSQGTSFTL